MAMAPDVVEYTVMNTGAMEWIIRGGTIMDGLGGVGFVADIGLRGGRIAAIGCLDGVEAAHVFDAAGQWVCPGFIDAHSHSDAYLLVDPRAVSKISQGITTEVTGNCGASAAPRYGGYQMPSDWLEQEYPGDWHSVVEYRALLEQQKPAVNVVLLAGHRTLRAAVMGSEARAATEAEVAQMVELLEEAMEQGAAGLSSGLIYAPAMYAERGELIALARVAARRNGLYATHMRSEGARLLEAIGEALDVVRESGVRLQISHLKTAGRANWSKIDEALERIAAARASGVEVRADRYPYTASCTDLDVILPVWASQGGRAAILERLRHPETRQRIREELLAEKGDTDWDSIWIGSTRHPENRAFTGGPLLAAAEAWGLQPVDAALRLMDTDDLFTGGIFFGMCEENMRRILCEPWVMLGSDASIRAPDGPLSADHPHPRAYGTMPKFLRMALDGKWMLPEEAVHKMTGLPAEQFRLKDRGVLREGAWADVTVIEPKNIAGKATYKEPHRLSTGVSAVWVNGGLSWRGGEGTGERYGRFLD